jgi:hypothetical protein
VPWADDKTRAGKAQSIIKYMFLCVVSLWTVFLWVYAVPGQVGPHVQVYPQPAGEQLLNQNFATRYFNSFFPFLPSPNELETTGVVAYYYESTIVVITEVGACIHTGFVAIKARDTIHHEKMTGLV